MEVFNFSVIHIYIQSHCSLVYNLKNLKFKKIDKFKIWKFEIWKIWTLKFEKIEFWNLKNLKFEIWNNMINIFVFRQGKFLLYWLTTTSTSTLTSYTATTTLGVSCIPSNMNACWLRKLISISLKIELTEICCTYFCQINEEEKNTWCNIIVIVWLIK